MLTIKDTSWHYRLWRLPRENKNARPKNLCRYFWALFFTITIPIVLCVLALVGIVALIWVMATHLVTTAVVIGCILFLVGFGILGYFQQKRYEEKQRNRPPAPPKEPSLVRQYLAAKKRKICPLIEVERVSEL